MLIFFNRALLFVLACVCLPLTNVVNAAEVCDNPVGRLVSVQALVDMRRGGSNEWQRLENEDLLCPGDMIRVGGQGRAAVSFFNNGLFQLNQNASFRLHDGSTPEKSFVRLVRGVIDFFSRQPRSLEIDTPFVNAAAEGTEFVIRVDDQRTEIIVYEGRVVAANDRGRVVLESGRSGFATKDAAPSKMVVVRPEDAVQWALYYPPIVTALGDRSGPGSPDLEGPLAEAVRLAGEGDLAGAFDALERVTEAKREARYHVFRGLMLLNVGQVDEAKAEADAALAKNPSAGLAWSLRSVIAVAGNDRDRALMDARKGIELAPDEAAAGIALSYALQANQELEVEDVLLEAVSKHPDDGLAWARLSEIWLMLGQRRKALEAVQTAEKLAPKLERVQTILGFTALASLRYDDAALAFRRAITLDTANPLPRLGLGLTYIREGDLEGGRKELEIAAGLDPGNALVRSYLGKAYFEERRDAYAGRELRRAKELDPRDPTPYLYDAIRKQTENRPVEALRDFERSIDLNDNRAVYRSRLLLDSDLAARGASLGRVYEDLGFEQLGVREATRSLTLDPGSASAHRFLSDLYATQSGREIARVSELLQAQMLQPLNINPVQPSIAETNLNIVTRGGPARPGFNEFTPMFQRNQARLNLSGTAGNKETLAGEAVASGVYDRFSVSAGHFHFQSDGFRPNNDNKEDVTSLFAQAAITPEFGAQVEYRRREGAHGDLFLNFDPESFSEGLRRDLESETARVGLRYEPHVTSTLLLAATLGERDETIDRVFAPGNRFTLEREDDGYQIEGQYLGDFSPIDLVLGFNVYDFDVRFTNTDTFFGTVDISEFKREQETGYAYVHLNFPRDVTWTVGLAYDSFSERDRDLHEVNPKFGVQWQVTDGLRLRAAYFDAVRPTLAGNQTLQPTQVAGFNQFYDDLPSAEFRFTGVGIDIRLLQDLNISLEGYLRNVDSPIYVAPSPFATVSGTLIEKHNERSARADVYWTPFTQWAFGIGVSYDKFEAKRSFDFAAPTRVETYVVPITARYFSPLGLFATAAVNVVDQDVDRRPGFGLAEGHDLFTVVDAAIGYRLPKRLGVMSFEVRNLFDRRFKYQDNSFREFERDVPSISRFTPERTVFGRITFNL